MRSPRPHRTRAVGVFLLAVGLGGHATATPPPSVEALFGAPRLEAPLLDPLPECGGASGEEGVCARLRRAWQELRTGRAVEAAADALRAAAATPEGVGPTALGEEARYLRAEGLARAGRRAEAGAIFEGLAGGPDPRLRALAALRRADLRLDAGRAAEAAADYAQVLPAVREGLGDAGRVWSRRAAEASLAAGDPAGALAWLEAAVATPGGQGDGSTELRLGDVLAAAGRFVEAEDCYRRIATSRERTPESRTARLRLAALEADGPAAAQAVLRAERAAGEPGVAAYAASLLAERRLANADAEGALAALEGIPRDGLSPEIEAGLRTALGAALRLVVGAPADDAGCLRALSAGGGSLVSLARWAGAAEVATTAARCARRLGLDPAGAVASAGSQGPTDGSGARDSWPSLAAADGTLARGRALLREPGVSPSP